MGETFVELTHISQSLVEQIEFHVEIIQVVGVLSLQFVYSVESVSVVLLAYIQMFSKTFQFIQILLILGWKSVIRFFNVADSVIQHPDLFFSHLPSFNAQIHLDGGVYHVSAHLTEHKLEGVEFGPLFDVKHLDVIEAVFGLQFLVIEFIIPTV